MLRIPGFIDIGTEIPSGSWQEITVCALRNGYTALLAAPVTERVYTQKADVLSALDEPARMAACDYAKMAVITPENIRTVEEWAEEVPAAMVDFSVFEDADSFVRMNLISRVFNRWPDNTPICVRGDENQIGSAVFMAQVHNKKIHVCSVATRTEIEIVSEAKRDGLSVTCDIHPLALLFSSETQGSTGPIRKLGTEEDRLALWQHFSDIDCFSSAGYCSPNGKSSEALSIMMPLLFSMRNAEMITDEDIIRRCCLNPSRIFGIPLDRETLIELDETVITSGHDACSGVNVIKLHGKAAAFPGESQTAGSNIAARIRGFAA